MDVKFDVMGDPWGARMLEMFPALYKGFVQSDPGNVSLVPYFAANYQKFRTFKLRENDVWILSYPKAGSHWVQEMAWCLLHDCDFELAKKTPADLRFPLIDLDYIMEMKPGDLPRLPPFGKTRFEIAEGMASPRFIKSHLPLSLLPLGLLDTCKVIYIARNPFDTVVSYHHHYKVVFGDSFTASFEEFFEAFMAEKILWDPYKNNIIEAWNKREHKNLCLFFYEEMKLNLDENIKKMCTFLGKSISDSNREKLLEHLSFDSFKKNTSVNWEARKDAVNSKHDFLRKGIVGSWKEVLNESQVARIKEMMNQHFKPIGLNFICE